MSSFSKYSTAYLLVLGLALILRIPFLGESFWLDEAAQALESARPLSEQLNIAFDFQPPLLHFLLHFALKIGDSEVWLRTVGALIPGIVTIFYTMKVGDTVGNRAVGILSGLFLATNPFHIFYSQELRPYSLSALWGVMSWWYLLEHFTAEGARQTETTKFKYSFKYLGTSILGLYTTYLYPFLLLSQATYLLLHRHALRRRYLEHLLLILVAVLPLFPLFLSQLTIGTELRTQLPGWENVVSFSQLQSIPLIIGKFLFGSVDLKISFTFILPVVLLFSGLLLLIVTRNFLPSYKPKSFTILIFWLLVPIVSSWMVSFLVPVVQPKRLLFLLPAWIIFVLSIGHPAYSSFFPQFITGQKINEYLYRRLQLVASWIVISVVIGTQFVGLLNLYTNAQSRREDWRSAYEYITQTYDAHSSIVVFSFVEPFAPWQWYDTDNYPSFSTGTYSIDQFTNAPEILKSLNDYEYVLVFDYLRDLTDPQNRIGRALINFGYEERAVLDFNSVGFVRVYSKQSGVLTYKVNGIRDV